MTRRKVLIAVAIAGSLASGLAVFQAHQPLDFDRSPTKPIPTGPPRCINGGGTRVYRVVPPEEPMSMPRRTGLSGDDYQLTWDYTENKKHETDQPLPEIVPLDVERLELVAFGTWHPRADDPLPLPENWSRPVQLRDPQSLEVLTGTRLQELGMPGKFLSLITDREWYEENFPNLRLIFRGRVPYPSLGVRAVDARSQNPVAAKNEACDPRTWTAIEGDWICADIPLPVWHDTSLRIKTSYFSGRPHFGELVPELGAQTVIGDQVRVQWVGAFDQDYIGKEDLHVKGQSSLRFKYTSEPSRSLLRVSDERLLENVGVIDGSGRTRWVTRSIHVAGTMVGEAGILPDSAAPLRLVLMPCQLNDEFTIAGMPDLPNPRSVNDLFEIILPRVTVPDGEDGSEYFVAFISGRATQSDFVADHPDKSATIVHALLPPDRTFRNMSVQELVNWYVANSTGAKVEYYEEYCCIVFNQPKRPWDMPVKQWWNAHAPSWLGGN